MTKKINFASDNYAGIHPDILNAITIANTHAEPAYGGDSYTEAMEEHFQQHFGADIKVYCVFNGTGANVTSLAAISRSYQAVISAASAHIQMDECGAPEKFTGSKLLLIPTTDGKIRVPSIKQHLQRIGDQHHVQARVISISQSTEYGTIYTPDEIKAIADFAHANHLFLHVDGARISNAAASLNTSLRAVTRDCGVDVLSFGGTKNGMMLGEAVVFFNRELAENFLYVRKQSMQLASKMRFIAAQFSALLTNNLWQRNAAHANRMAQKLAEILQKSSAVRLTQAVEANAVFAIFPPALIEKLRQHFYFYVWNEENMEVRLMTSFSTTEAEVEKFAEALIS